MTSEELDALLAQTPPLSPRERPTNPPPMSGPVASALSRAALAPVSPGEPPRPLGPTPEQRALQRVALERAIAAVRKRCWPKLADAILGCRPRTPSAILLGPSGCGKTSAARFLVAGRLAHWVKAEQLSVCEREHRLGDGEPEAVRVASDASRLVLDDIRAGQEVTALWRVLDRRYDAGLPTIATTGLTRAGLLEHLGAAGLRRLTEQFSGHPVLIVDCHGDVR